MQNLPNGVKLVVTASDPRRVAKLKALGFMASWPRVHTTNPITS
jgi:hypothetical protein